MPDIVDRFLSACSNAESDKREFWSKVKDKSIELLVDEAIEDKYYPYQSDLMLAANEYADMKTFPKDTAESFKEQIQQIHESTCEGIMNLDDDDRDAIRQCIWERNYSQQMTFLLWQVIQTIATPEQLKFINEIPLNEG